MVELRDDRGWSIEEMQGRLRELDVEIGASTLYAYERGHDTGGTDLPINATPYIARL